MTGAASDLVDPKDLTALERRALEDVTRLQLHRTRGGYANVNCKPVPLKVAEKLERLKLIRSAYDRKRAAHTLVATGLGITILDIIRLRRERKEQ